MTNIDGEYTVALIRQEPGDTNGRHPYIVVSFERADGMTAHKHFVMTPAAEWAWTQFLANMGVKDIPHLLGIHVDLKFDRIKHGNTVTFQISSIERK